MTADKPRAPRVFGIIAAAGRSRRMGQPKQLLAIDGAPLLVRMIDLMLAAALDGIDCKDVPPRPLNNVNLYHLDKKERRKLGVGELPGSLAEALRELEKDTVLREALGSVIFDAFTRAKWEEWDDFRLRVSDYEIERYLETA